LADREQADHALAADEVEVGPLLEERTVAVPDQSGGEHEQQRRCGARDRRQRREAGTQLHAGGASARWRATARSTSSARRELGRNWRVGWPYSCAVGTPK